MLITLRFDLKIRLDIVAKASPKTERKLSLSLEKAQPTIWLKSKTQRKLYQARVE